MYEHEEEDTYRGGGGGGVYSYSMDTIEGPRAPAVKLTARQRNTTQSSTVLARPVCPHVCDSDSARATTPSFFSPCGAPLPPFLLAHNLLVPRVH